ncbi:winged helix-turn-helix transcriptional regulator [Actinomadura roseirufa]|uniref:winged helix-turn-helix transcriptional regulator n=1 Tax=Actinomadura roseirufa TaxID=2094049 RepID=UPI001040FC40|nr:helix-turn-helix domain-containing protein [Actinomadura roseirufa]
MYQRYSDVTDRVGQACPVAAVLDRVAGKWGIGILMALGERPVRFTELERAITGISRRMLTLKLRGLERDGLLVRTVHPTVPPKVEYTLSPSGHELRAALLALSGWAGRHSATVAAAQAEYDRENARR